MFIYINDIKYSRLQIEVLWFTHGVVAETTSRSAVIAVVTPLYHVTVVSKHRPRTVAGDVGLWADPVEMIDSWR